MTAQKPGDLVSGALVLQRVKTGTGGQCTEPKCQRQGRFKIRIAGHYVKGPSYVQPYAYLCPGCATAEIERWDELAGRAPIQGAVAA